MVAPNPLNHPEMPSLCSILARTDTMLSFLPFADAGFACIRVLALLFGQKLDLKRHICDIHIEWVHYTEPEPSQPDVTDD
jgi:hypothetical protein